MPFNKPTLIQIVDRIKSDLKARITGASTFLRNSVLSILSTVFGAAVHLLYDYLEYMKDQLFITTSDTKYLELQGAEYGISRSFGAYATGTLTAIGTDGTVIPTGARLQTSLGTIYISQAVATIASNVASVSVQAELIGSAANASEGTTVTFISPIPGINTETTVDSGGIINGSDSENDEALRNRILTRKRQPPSGGTEDDYIVWAKEVSGVTRAWSFPQLYGSGTIGVAFSRDNDTPITPSEAERANVRSYIVSHEDPLIGKIIGCPVTAEPGLVIIALQPLAVNFYIKTKPYNATVVASMNDRLSDLLFEKGGAGKSITISQMYEALTAATGEDSSELISPSVDSTADYNQIHVLGDVVIEALQ